MKLLIADPEYRLPAELKLPEGITELAPVRSVAALQQKLLSEEPELLLLSDGWCRSPMPVISPMTVWCVLMRDQSYSAAEHAIRAGCFDLLDASEDPLAMGNALLRMQQDAAGRNRRQTILRENFWQHLIEAGKDADLELLKEEANEYHVTLSGFFQPIYIRFQQTDNPETCPISDTLLERKLRGAVWDCFRPVFPEISVVHSNHSTYVLILQCQSVPDVKNAICHAAEGFLQKLQEMHLRAVAILGDIADISGISASIAALKRRGWDQVYIQSQLIPAEVDKQLISQPLLPDSTDFLRKLDCRMYDEALQDMQKFLYDPEIMRRVNMNYLENFRYQILDGIRQLTIVKKTDENITGHIDREVIRRANTSVQDFLTLIEAICTELRKLEEEKVHKPRDPVSQAQQLIEQKLSTELDRNMIAASLFVNPDYLDRVFRQRLGMTVTGYIMQQRIQLACRMLSGGNLSVSAVADKCGFSNVALFSRNFKKQTGMSPMEYKSRDTSVADEPD